MAQTIGPRHYRCCVGCAFGGTQRYWWSFSGDPRLVPRDETCRALINLISVLGDTKLADCLGSKRKPPSAASRQGLTCSSTTAASETHQRPTVANEAAMLLLGMLTLARRSVPTISTQSGVHQSMNHTAALTLIRLASASQHATGSCVCCVLAIRLNVMLCYVIYGTTGLGRYTRGTELRADPYSFTGPRGRRIEKELVNGVTDVISEKRVTPSILLVKKMWLLRGW